VQTRCERIYWSASLSLSLSTLSLTAALCLNSQDEEATRKAAIQKVAAGQQAENLLDFDDAPAIEGQAPTGIAAAVANTPGVSKVLTSSNPLDDLVSIFGGTGATGFGAPTSLTLGAVSSPVGGLVGAGGLGGLDMFGGSPLTTTPIAPLPAQANAPKPAASTSQQEDLLGLF